MLRHLFKLIFTINLDRERCARFAKAQTKYRIVQNVPHTNVITYLEHNTVDIFADDTTVLATRKEDQKEAR